MLGVNESMEKCLAATELVKTPSMPGMPLWNTELKSSTGNRKHDQARFLALCWACAWGAWI